MAISSSMNDSLDNTIPNTSAKLETKQTLGGAGSSEEMQNSFLTLLVAQLKNQDPTNPLQNNELTSQLAQISTVQGIEKLNTTLGSISGQIDSNQSLQASALLGHGVMVPGNSILAGSKDGEISTTPFGMELMRGADKVTATISDSNGQVIKTIEFPGGLKAGVHVFTWDGKLEDGSNAPDGAYTVSIAASSGVDSLAATALTFGVVNAVTKGADGTKLDLGTRGTVTMDDVRQIL
ncbi:basal-body rod modification protein flgD [Yersinia ruckeri]|uniref:flagellar hook assembly protein FlgD n=1 Tax=Yersinia ruckeri TaxID=29486 RepID=UPI0005ACDA47|nr:flagellar hook assembly protein FlgD [Yersinia ruckeri]AJI96095.1 basal-body rod modification protein flgD [Yersinia ruckeri]MCW6569083.1 flagellar hook assembly protein FlgD [Yersinia ruckeri]